MQIDPDSIEVIVNKIAIDIVTQLTREEKYLIRNNKYKITILLCKIEKIMHPFSIFLFTSHVSFLIDRVVVVFMMYNSISKRCTVNYKEC
jgi:hypothetical protein